MKRKGFTLIELLAVIVVLAVIAIITTPVILGVIEKSKKESYRNSIYGIMESANIYLANHLTNIGKTKEIAFTCNGINCSNEEGDSLDFKGTVPKSGTFYLNGAGEVTVESVYNGKYYANTVDDKVEITEEDTTLSRAELTNMVKELQQEVKQLKTQVQQSNQNTSNIAALQTKHDSDVTSIWNKVGTEDLSSISNGSISKILINQNKLISDLNKLVTNNQSNVTNMTSQMNNLNSKLDSKANTSHTHDDRYYTESEINAKLNAKANSSDLANLQTIVNNHTTYINAKLDKSNSRDDTTGGIMQYREFTADANYMLNSGIYRIAPETRCMPVTGYGVLLVINATYDYGSSTTAWIKQIYFPNSAPEIFYVRENINYNASNWTGWKKFVTSTTNY